MDSNASSRVVLSGSVCPDDALVRHLLDIGHGGEKLDCLVAERSQLRKSKRLRGHLWSFKLPSGSLIPVECRYEGVDLFVCSPELVFYQLAVKLSVAEAIYFGMVLCSDFRLEPSARGGAVLRAVHDAPLTSIARIRAFLAKMPGGRAPERALRALEHVAEHARSPKECALGMLFSLPTKMGGFDLGTLSFNVAFQVFGGTDYLGNEKVWPRIPDIVLEHKEKTGVRRFAAIDYDPAVTHSGVEKELLDTRRRNEIAGVRKLAHFTITSEDIKSFEYLEVTAERIRRALGRPKRPCLRCSQDSLEGREALFEARRKRLALWRQFIVPPFAAVVGDLPIEGKRVKGK